MKGKGRGEYRGWMIWFWDWSASSANGRRCVHKDVGKIFYLNSVMGINGISRQREYKMLLYARRGGSQDMKESSDGSLPTVPESQESRWEAAEKYKGTDDGRTTGERDVCGQLYDGVHRCGESIDDKVFLIERLDVLLGSSHSGWTDLRCQRIQFYKPLIQCAIPACAVKRGLAHYFNRFTESQWQFEHATVVLTLQ